MEIQLTVGAWYGDNTLSVKVPESSDIKYFRPIHMEGISNERIQTILKTHFHTSEFIEKLKGKQSVCIVTDDITRPTPVQYPLELLIEAISTYIPPENITILIATGAHKPMTKEEIIKKFGERLAKDIKILNHSFMGEDIIQLGELMNGPVQLNRNFLDADLRITVGGVLPHNEAGFGGGAKLIIPGIAGEDSITFFHGALPPRKIGEIESSKSEDRRKWAEEVSKHVGVDLSIFILINSDRKPVDIVIGDIVEAHRIAAKMCKNIARTPISKEDVDQADICVVNCYPLDSDPIQMGKALLSARKFFKQKKTIVINNASDGIFYHGMGMGCGINSNRLFRNAGRFFEVKRMRRYLITIGRLLLKPSLLARYSYFHLNALDYNEEMYLRESVGNKKSTDPKSDLIIYSKNFPAFGARQKYPNSHLITELQMLEKHLSFIAPNKKIVVIPCAPLQLLEYSSD